MTCTAPVHCLLSLEGAAERRHAYPVNGGDDACMRCWQSLQRAAHMHLQCTCDVGKTYVKLFLPHWSEYLRLKESTSGAALRRHRLNRQHLYSAALPVKAPNDIHLLRSIVKYIRPPASPENSATRRCLAQACLLHAERRQMREGKGAGVRQCAHECAAFAIHLRRCPGQDRACSMHVAPAMCSALAAA